MAPDPVPRTHQVVPGALVNVVMKADQPTGRQVRGTVQNVLTKGDHHRGIKVRLTDGRIGRVQSMAVGVSSMQSSSGPTSSTMDDPDPGPSLLPAPGNIREPRGGRGYRPRYRDARFEDSPDAAPEQMDLGAFIVPSRRKGRGKKRVNISQPDEMDTSEGFADSSSSYQASTDVTSATATCPVCGTFEGDEAAVAHHVAEHFGS